MKAIEFETFIEDHTVSIPSEYEYLEHEKVKVIILYPEKTKSTNYNKKVLFSAFKKAKEMNAFSDIDNASHWQKQVRDEWE